MNSSQVLMNRYQIQSELGRGGMGVVYKAYDLSLQRDVALKVMLGAMNSQSLERFFREAQGLAQFVHPNIVRIFDFGRLPGGEPYLVMEFIEGASLLELRRRQQLPLERLCEALTSVATALHAAHSKGVLHRDLKPQNILLRAETGEPVLLDFGVARFEDKGASLTEEGAIVGTLDYMAPEQADGQRVDARADVYGLGATFYHLLTDQTLFPGVTAHYILVKKIFEDTPVAPNSLVPELPTELSEFCLRCLAKDPAQRPQSALDFAEELRQCLAEPQPKTSKSGPKLLLVALALLALVVGALYLAAPATGQLRLRSELEGLSVGLKSEPLVPLTKGQLAQFDWPAGAQQLVLKRQGVSLQKPLRITSGSVQSLTLKPEFVIGLTSVPRATVAVFDAQGQLLSVRGQTERPLPQQLTLPLGRVRVRVSAPGYVAREQVLEVNQEQSLEIKLESEPWLFDMTLPSHSGGWHGPIMLDIDGDGHLEMLQAMRSQALAKQTSGPCDLVCLDVRRPAASARLWSVPKVMSPWTEIVCVQREQRHYAVALTNLPGRDGRVCSFIDVSTGKVFKRIERTEAQSRGRGNALTQMAKAQWPEAGEALLFNVYRHCQAVDLKTMKSEPLKLPVACKQYSLIACAKDLNAERGHVLVLMLNNSSLWAGRLNADRSLTYQWHYDRKDLRYTGGSISPDQRWGVFFPHSNFFVRKQKTNVAHIVVVDLKDKRVAQVLTLAASATPRCVWRQSQDGQSRAVLVVANGQSSTLLTMNARGRFQESRARRLKARVDYVSRYTKEPGRTLLVLSCGQPREVHLLDPQLDFKCVWTHKPGMQGHAGGVDINGDGRHALMFWGWRVGRIKAVTPGLARLAWPLE